MTISSISRPIYKGKVCVICPCGLYEYNLWILDFNGAGTDGFMTKSPTLRFKGTNKLIFCVLDSYVYVFDGGKGTVSRCERKWMSKYDLRPHLMKSAIADDLDLVIDSNLLKKFSGPSMNHSKWGPWAVPTPDGRGIVVYSKVLSFRKYKDVEREFEGIDFELFDVESNKWKILPRLELLYKNGWSFYQLDHVSGKWIEHEDVFLSSGWPKDRAIFLLSQCSFINNSNTFLAVLSDRLIFALNLDSPEQGWRLYQDEGVRVRPRWSWNDQLLVVEGRVLVSPYEVDNGVVRYNLGLSDIPPGIKRSDIHVGRSVYLIKYVENQECIVCVGGSGLDDEDFGYMVFDLFKIDLLYLDDDKMERPIHLQSYGYSLPQKYTYCFLDKLVPMVYEVSPNRELSKNALRNKKKRENRRRKKAAQVESEKVEMWEVQRRLAELRQIQDRDIKHQDEDCVFPCPDGQGMIMSSSSDSNTYSTRAPQTSPSALAAEVARLKAELEESRRCQELMRFEMDRMRAQIETLMHPASNPS